MKMSFISTRIVVVALILVFSPINSSQDAGVAVYMNKVWPAGNPVETYRYYDFPFCSPTVVEEGRMSLGQIMRGDRLVSSLYRMRAGTGITKESVCSKDLTVNEVDHFIEAIREKYMYEVVIAGLPVSVPFGRYPDEQTFLCAHLLFTVGYTPDNKIVAGSADCVDQVELHEHTPQHIEFFYSVYWEMHTEKVDSANFQQSQLNSVMSLLGISAIPKVSVSFHWISIVNSLILTLMIFSLVLVILVRVVRSDLLTQYLPGETEMAEKGESELFVDSDNDHHHNTALWKLLHGDIFRPPVHRMWLCAAVGSGIQLLLVGTILAVVGSFIGSSQRGTLATAGIVMYMVSSALSGFVSARLYQRLGGMKWGWNILVTALLFTGPAFLVWSILNTIAILNRSTAAFPFLTIVQLFAMWALVTMPLTIIGGIVGRQTGIKYVKSVPFPVKTNRLCREIPKSSIFTSMKFQMTTTGFLAFWSIYLELKFVFQSLWMNSQLYSLYGVLVVAVALLFLLVTVLTVLFAYFHLNAENYKWWWRAFLSGGSVAVFFMIYCGYFYATSPMYGAVQTSFFFLYSALIGYAIALACGAVTFAATYSFVWFIYSHVKSD